MAQDQPPRPVQATVTVMEGPHAGAELELAGEPAYVIGRGHDCDLQIRDRSVSREHTRIEFDGQYYWLVDCGSSNGTLVNEEPVHRYMLYDGDMIRAGKVSMVYRCPPVAVAAEQ